MAYCRRWSGCSTSGSARAREIRSRLEALRKQIPSGERVRVIGGDEHDRWTKATEGVR
jgi:ribulose bisphosphate carboxylase small subunit